MKTLTLTRIENTPERQFGFARDDDDNEFYVPAMVIKRLQMTSADEGRRVVASIKEWGGYVDRHPTLQLPCEFVTAESVATLLQAKSEELAMLQGLIHTLIGDRK